MASAAQLVQGPEASAERQRIAALRDTFIKQLQQRDYPIILNGPRSDLRHPGNVNIQFCGFDAETILGTLQPHIAASTGSACTSGIPEPSHVLRAIGLNSNEAESSIRFSFGRFTTDDQIESMVDLIDSTLKKLVKAELREIA